ncbi:MAG: cob(I)yrinic acid a,c-diamide adenosyltransferase [Nitrospirae bacterium]|nr:cob(I)yrinic acid a,c-diamide adenosyltransferase [Nitrospirota bacterium]
MSTGCIHIYTGEGKGKTTAAVGLAVRAKSRGLRVLFVQFLKGGADAGEVSILKDISVTIKKFSDIQSPFFNPDIDRGQLKKDVDKALAYVKSVMQKEGFDMIILDEFNCLLVEGLLTEDKAVDFISNKPDRLELVLTGRGATKRLIEAADYVTEMKMIKHPFSKGMGARRGIEF